MPEKGTLQRVRKLKRQRKAPSTQAGEFVREEIQHVRQGKHGARSAKQAIAIGLSKARRAGVKLKPPAPGQASEETRKNAARAYEQGQRRRQHRGGTKRARATLGALRREGRRAASERALARQARAQTRRRTRSRA
jgi:hypothetical protein